jgi:hypothetical protein
MRRLSLTAAVLLLAVPASAQAHKHHGHRARAAAAARPATLSLAQGAVAMYANATQPIDGIAPASATVTDCTSLSSTAVQCTVSIYGARFVSAYDGLRGAPSDLVMTEDATIEDGVVALSVADVLYASGATSGE